MEHIPQTYSLFHAKDIPPYEILYWD